MKIIFMSRLWKFTLIILSVSVVLASLAIFPLFDDRVHLVFCNVGEGDAILIYKQSVQILVDGGPDSKVLKCLSSHMPFWDRKIEVVALSHAEADHYTGLLDVAKRYDIENFASSGIDKDSAGYRELLERLNMVGAKRIKMRAGGEIKVGGIDLLALWPTDDWIAQKLNVETVSQDGRVLGVQAKESLNEYSLVLKIVYKDFKALLDGDIEPPAEDLLAQRVGGPLDVLKVPHHGSKNGLDENLLSATTPALAVISVGKNRFGHPHIETLSLLERNNIKVMRTDINGEVEIVTNGKEWGLRAR